MDASKKDNRKGFAQNIFVYAAATMPFLLSIVFHAIGATPQKPAQTTVRPALAFDQYLVHLGDVPLRQTHFARYRFTNRSDRTVTIRELKPSCGCLSPQLKRNVYEPSESGEFYLRVRTATEQPGPNEYYCDVKYDDGTQRSTRVVFKVNLPEKTVIVRPPALMFYQRTDEPTIREISVTDFRPQRLKLLGVECSSKLVQVALGEADFDSEGNHVQKVLVKVGPVPEGRHQATVTILTDDSEFPQLTVPLLIEGPVTAIDRVTTEHDHLDRRIHQ